MTDKRIRVTEEICEKLRFQYEYYCQNNSTISCTVPRQNSTAKHVEWLVNFLEKNPITPPFSQQ